MLGYRVNTRGRYKCLFCDHWTYKTLAGIDNHVQGRHALELAEATTEALRAEVDRLKTLPPKVVEKVVYREPPAKKDKEYWYIENGGGIYCETCKTVQMRVGIPKGQTIENTPHVCGNKTLKLVIEVTY